MGNIAIIPARGGSKRIPQKNIKLFNGNPIISYVIETIEKSNLFDEIMVSTDNDEITTIAKKYNAKVPFLRSDKNANDFATLTDVILEVLVNYKNKGIEFDNVCCILPTAALISETKVVEAFRILEKNKFSSVVPVVKFSYPIQRALKNESGLLKMREAEYINTRSQDLEDIYHDSGQFYWINIKDFFAENKIFTNNTGFIELGEMEAQDVDTIEDWAMLELKYKHRKGNI